MASKFQRRHHEALCKAMADSYVLFYKYKGIKPGSEDDKLFDKFAAYTCLNLCGMLKQDNPSFQWSKWRDTYIARINEQIKRIEK
jgi:hypothetical protein